MQKINPNKWIRKAISTALNGMIVNALAIPTYDTRVPIGQNPNYYVLMTSQNKDQSKQNKCEDFWTADILLDIVTKYQASGNTGSRVLVDDIEDEIRNRTKVLIVENFDVIFQNVDSSGLDNINNTSIVFRNLYRISLTLK